MGKYQSDNPSAKKNRKPKTPGSKKKKIILPLILLAIAAALIAFFVHLNTLPGQVDNGASKPPVEGKPDVGDSSSTAKPVDPSAPRALLDGKYTFVLAGTNDDYNTDTLMIGTLDANTKKIDMISIPRDSMIDIPKKIKRINSSYGWGGAEGMLEQVARVTGISAQYYCVVNIEDFIQIVDLVGGVEFDVPYDMYHKGLGVADTINLKKGVQTLDGFKALQLVRFRGTKDNDFGRIQMQKDFLVALLQTVVEKFSISQVTDMISVISESVKTNMPIVDMVRFYTTVVSNMDLAHDITFYTMPYTGFGRYGGQDYVYLDKEKSLELINDTINPYNKPITADDVTIIKLED